MADTVEKRAFKRIRKKSFLTKQKQHGKKGRFGKGVELSEENYQYFLRILEVIKASKDNAEDMSNLASNVLEEISNIEVDTCSNQLASRVVEEVLPYAPNDKLIALGDKLGTELRLVFTDPFCSHVLQQLVVTLAKRLLDTLSSVDDTIKEKLNQNFVRVAMFAINNIEDFIFDTYANHTLRTIFACVNGNAVKTEETIVAKETSSTPLPDTFEDLSVKFVKKVTQWPQFDDLTSQVLTSGCLQALIISVRNNIKLSKTIVKRVLETSASYKALDLIDPQNKPFLHIVEASLLAAPPKQFQKLYEGLFKGNIRSIAVDKIGNLLIQKLVLHCVVKETFEEIYDEITEDISILSSLLDKGYTGLVHALGKSCLRFKTKQGDFTKLLMVLLNCEDPSKHNSIAPLIFCLTPFDKYDAENYKVNLHGSLLLQDMLNFPKPIRLVTSLLEMSENQLLSLLSDPRGCHITDAFVASQFVGEKSREKLFKKMQGYYARLASSKHGSRSFDAIWSCLNGKQKSLIMDELKADQSAVVATLCGRVIASKTKLDLFRQDREKWFREFSSEKSSSKKRKLDEQGDSIKKQLKNV